jgi:serine/threonine-protein phosphatase 2B catalytic subunit
MEFLTDPLQDRVVKSLPPLAAIPLSRDRIWRDNEPDIPVIKEHLLREGHIEKAELLEIIKKAISIMKNEPNAVKVSDPNVIIVGDIHG